MRTDAQTKLRKTRPFDLYWPRNVAELNISINFTRLLINNYFI